jgi:hypothetical protein
MTPAAADWVYRHVLTAAYRRSVGAEARADRDDDMQLGPRAVRICPCQYGRCGWCTNDRHDQCTHHRWASPPSPAARLLSRSGSVLAEVWPTGKPCAWRCACGCRAPAVQLDLFAVGSAS